MKRSSRKQGYWKEIFRCADVAMTQHDASDERWSALARVQPQSLHRTPGEQSEAVASRRRYGLHLQQSPNAIRSI
jgi:hypothetical protein